jgi:hypothetical protein
MTARAHHAYHTHRLSAALCRPLRGSVLDDACNPGRRSFLASPGLWSTRAFGPVLRTSASAKLLAKDPGFPEDAALEF